MRRARTPQFDDDTQHRDQRRIRRAARSIDGFFDGRLGALTGTSGGKNFAEACNGQRGALAER
jgi:hypothetical protein